MPHAMPHAIYIYNYIDYLMHLFENFFSSEAGSSELVKEQHICCLEIC